MPNLRIDQLYSERPVAAKEFTSIRHRISAWANSIPHHPHANLGSSITITQAFEKPTHTVLLTTSYERRSLEWKVSPYHGERISPVPVTENQIDVWGIPLPDLATPSEGGRDTEQDIALTDTQSLVQCDPCSGRGQDVCWACHGAGFQTCGSCTGGWYRCYSCDGSGRVQSGEFNNRPTYISCGSCAGRGEIRCYHCGGRGEVRCGICQGSGRLVCRSCEGQGVLLCFLSVRQSKSTHGRFKRIHHAATPDAWKCDFPTLPVVTIKGRDLWGADRLRTPVPELNQAIRSLLAASERPKGREYGAVGRELRVIGWVLRIRQVPHFEVNYSFNGRPYSLWLHGSEERVHAPNSPVADVRDSYRKEAFKLHRQGGAARVEALGAINKAAAMGQLSPQEESLRNRILLALQFPHIAGGLLGGMGCLAAIEWLRPPFVGWKLCLAAACGWLTGVAMFKRTFSVIRKPIVGFACAFVLSVGLAAMTEFAPDQVTSAFISVLLLACLIRGGYEKPSPPQDVPQGTSETNAAAGNSEAEDADWEPGQPEDEAPPYAGGYEGEAANPEPASDANDTRETVETIWARSILGVSSDASEAEINSAYRRKMTEYHPDKVSHLPKEYRDLAEEKSKELNKAREILRACPRGV